MFNVVFHIFPSHIKQVIRERLDGRDIGYTTTLKLMQIMSEKGLVVRNTEARSHIYEAAMPEQDVQGQLLRRFVDTAFRGSAMNLVMQALGQHRADASELAQIKALIQEMEAGENSGQETSDDIKNP